MQEQGKTAPKWEAEVLEWMGTAYGRRKNANGAAQPNEAAATAGTDAKTSTASRAKPLAGFSAERGSKRGVIAGGAGLLAIVIAVALIEVRASSGLPGAAQVATGTQTDPQANASFELSKDADRQAEFERAAREAKIRLASERRARLALKGQVGQLASELAAQKLNRQNAEQANATTSAALAAERNARLEADKGRLEADKARLEAEQAAKASQEALARMASSAAAAPVAVVPVAAATVSPPPPPQAEPKPAEPKLAESKPAEPKSVDPRPAESSPAEPRPVATRSPPWEASVRVIKASLNAAANPDAATSALLEGEELFAKGDVAKARQRFEQAAGMGMPEAALALGNTYDRVSLAKAGLDLTGEPARARQWYRRALELARSRQGPDR